MEKAIHARIVGSLPVPNVQELAVKANESGEIPARYIYPQLESQVVLDVADVEIPVIDMGRLLDPQFSQDEAAKLHDACKEWGFFQLKNHGIPNDVIEKMKNDIIEFFNLSLEEKKALSQVPNSLEGYGQTMVTSEKHKLDWADMLYLVTRPEDVRFMKVWPAKPISFRDSLSNYSGELKKIIGHLLEVMTKNLGIAPEVLLSKFKDQPQGIKFNYYPPCLKAEKVLGIREHSDASAITLLLEVNGVQGLQIKMNEKWFAVKSLPGAFIVNIGDILEIITNGIYKSIEHRVMVNHKQERVTIAAFHGANQEAVVGPLPDLLKNGKEKYKAMLYREYMKGYFSERHEGKIYIEKLKI